MPTSSEPILGPAWTLQFEMVFYVVFAVLIASRAGGVLLLAAWLAWIGVAAVGFGAHGIPSALCGIYGVEFFMGMAAAHLVRRGGIPAPKVVAATGLLLFAASYIAESNGVLDGYHFLARFTYGLPATLLICGLTGVERAGWLTVPRWMQVLGGASYSVYLFQFVFIGVMWQVLLASDLAMRLPVSIQFLLLSAGAVAGGVVVSRTVERPLLRAVQGRPREVLTQQV